MNYGGKKQKKVGRAIMGNARFWREFEATPQTDCIEAQRDSIVLSNSADQHSVHL
jgi:hypothetical protein